MNWVAFLLHSTGHSIFKSTWQFTGKTIPIKTRRASQSFGPTLPCLFLIFEIKLPQMIVSYKWQNKTPKNVVSMVGIRTGTAEWNKSTGLPLCVCFLEDVLIFMLITCFSFQSQPILNIFIAFLPPEPLVKLFRRSLSMQLQSTVGRAATADTGGLQFMNRHRQSVQNFL